MISHVHKDSPAEKAGIKKGMYIHAFNGKKVQDLLGLSRRLIRIRSGETVSFGTSGGTFRLKTIQEKTLDPIREAERKLSLHLVPLTSMLARELSYPVSNGMVVSRPLLDSLASVRRGDLLIQLGRSVINSPADLAQALRDLHYNDTVRAVFLSPVVRRDRKYMIRRVMMLRVR